MLNIFNKGYRKDTHLREIASLLTLERPEASSSTARFSFKAIYRNQLQSGRFLSKDLGIVLNNRSTHDETKTLEDVRFVTGDYLDISLSDRSLNSENEKNSIVGRSNLSSRLGDRLSGRNSNRFAPYNRDRPSRDTRRGGADSERWEHINK